MQGVLVVIVLDVLISVVFGLYIDREEWHKPVLFGFNMLGVVILTALYTLGLLGPWWTWVVGIITPYLLIALVAIGCDKVQTEDHYPSEMY